MPSTCDICGCSGAANPKRVFRSHSDPRVCAKNLKRKANQKKVKHFERKKNKDIQYYRYQNPNVGERYFKVKEGKPVLQIIKSVQQKKGRAYCIGITFMSYTTFIGSWGWKKRESRFIKEISAAKFNSVLNKMIKTIQK